MLWTVIGWIVIGVVLVSVVASFFVKEPPKRDGELATRVLGVIDAPNGLVISDLPLKGRDPEGRTFGAGEFEVTGKGWRYPGEALQIEAIELVHGTVGDVPRAELQHTEDSGYLVFYDAMAPLTSKEAHGELRDAELAFDKRENGTFFFLHRGSLGQSSDGLFVRVPYSGEIIDLFVQQSPSGIRIECVFVNADIFARPENLRSGLPPD